MIVIAVISSLVIDSQTIAFSEKPVRWIKHFRIQVGKHGVCF